MKIIKLILKIVIVIVIILFIIFSYYKRNQSINFSILLPNKLEYCNKIIDINDIQYLELEKWFTLNQENWKNTPVSYMPNIIYHNINQNKYFHINVFEQYIIVNYENKNMELNQVIRSKNENELISNCDK